MSSGVKGLNYGKLEEPSQYKTVQEKRFPRLILLIY